MTPETIKRKGRSFLVEGIKIERELHQAKALVHAAEARRQKWRAKVNEAFATDALEFSNISCQAFIGGCVYTPHHFHGVGKRHCIFCGHDDFDLY